MKNFQIETPRLNLIPFSLADSDQLHRLWNEPGVRKYLWDDKTVPMETVVKVIESSIACFADYGFGFWTLRLKGLAEIIGFCGFRHFKFDDENSGQTEVEILYGLSTEHWGKGLATESVFALLQFGFEECGLECIYAGADPPNQASFRVMERLGMKFLRQTFIGGLGAVYYIIRRKELSANQSFHHCVSSLLPPINPEY